MASLKSPTSLVAALLCFFLQFSMIKAHYASEGIDSDLSERSLIVVKIWCLVIIFLGTFVCGLIPLLFRSKSKVLVLGNSFAAGVFLVISMHFLQDSANVSDDYTEGSSFLPFIFLLIGYVFILLVESFLFKAKKEDGETQALVRVEAGIKEGESVSDNISSNPRLVSKAAVEAAVVIILGLSLHSVFEGFTIGLAERDRYAWRYLWTIGIHKVASGLSLGIVVLRMQPKRPILTSIAYSFAFAISTPIGIIVSLIIKKAAQDGTADWVYVLTQAAASGVFLHVSIYHLLAKGFNPQDQSAHTTPFKRFFALCLGIGVVTIGLIFN
ncbi:hypothetical protein ACET3Z_005951 [Daucus carota]